MKQSRICMLDLEMSGLDPDEERIIEVACFVVEADLTPVEGDEMCLAVMPDDPGVLDTMDDWNTRTHGESGLIRRIREEGVSIAASGRRRCWPGPSASSWGTCRPASR